MKIELVAEIVILSEPKEIECTNTMTDEDIHKLRKEYGETLQKAGYTVKETYATYKGKFYSD